MDNLKYLKTRWRRWLGNKTAYNKPYWTSLLDTRWSCWCDCVCRNHSIKYEMDWTREAVKSMYSLCIDIATMDELRNLDGIYAMEKFE